MNLGDVGRRLWINFTKHMLHRCTGSVCFDSDLCLMLGNEALKVSCLTELHLFLVHILLNCIANLYNIKTIIIITIIIIIIIIIINVPSR